jgi:hypothetical protein
MRWKIEQFHREIKQYISIERNPCRTAHVQRNYIACAMLVWIRLTGLARQTKQTVYRIKHGLLDDYLCQQLKNPTVAMRLAQILMLNPTSNVHHTTATSTSPETHQETSSASPEKTPQRQYDVRPLTLGDLANNRKGLAASENEAANTLGAALEKIHNKLANKDMTPEEHLEECIAIREAAEMINGSLDVEDEVLAKFGLQGRVIEGKLDLELAPAEYLAINDDLGRQLNEENGVLETRQRLEQDARRGSARGRMNLERTTEGRLTLDQRLRIAGITEGRLTREQRLRFAGITEEAL